ncbi:hypothetical protein DSCO28_52150 [Desulfosarcina ovata subsp. sediminis]|uniref:histidine kinase n=1 Tax=Desulfosarcina ovata subsp. sediminis TaxID=885957 RepID=A0A5K7ZWL5_9BACT|nr:response regulator [Desulfosarcina ovata]BBO84649.1 hypothetical protein DSCO28_52150 [Desulfosarcina ovata subsp. sediminis]
MSTTPTDVSAVSSFDDQTSLYDSEIIGNDDACRYRAAWKEPPSSVWRRAGQYTALLTIAITAATAPFFPATAWGPLALALGLVCLCIWVVANRLEVGNLTRSLKAQEDLASHLREELDTRHHNARLVQEISLAGADILEIGTFLQTVLDSMARNLDFSRGMIVLCQDACRHLKHRANYGFSQPDQQVLDPLELELNPDDTENPFVQALNHGRPVFLEGIHHHNQNLSPSTLNVFKQLNIVSLIGVPLRHKDDPLGLMIVDARDGKKNRTASDIHLLMGIAAQVATGIVNARAYTQLQESEARYRLVTENVTDVIWIFDFQDLKITYISPSVEKMLGYTPDEIMDLPMDRYLTPDSCDKVAATLSTTLNPAFGQETSSPCNAVNMELEKVHKDGTIVPIEVIANFLTDKNGRPNAVLGISRDLSRRKEYEKARHEDETRRQQAKKMESLGTMAGSIAHNFNNLLMVVLGNLELAKEELNTSQPPLLNVQRAINASQRAADLSSMMLTYVGQLKKESVPVDLSQVAGQVLENMDETTMANVNLDLDLADPMPLIAADAGQMRQIISGFVTNAIEALGNKPGRVRISTGAMHCDDHFLAGAYLNDGICEGMYAFAEVADTGCGMDAETLSKAFDPFFSTKFTGRGLGLAAVLGIIRSHNGAIRVHSVKNEGSVFTALFPIQGISHHRRHSEAETVESPSTGKTVLLVDDETMVMDIGHQFLERLGYTVKMASSGQAALDIFRQAANSIDCLLLDFSMPDMNGLETLQHIKKIGSTARIIVTSGYTRQQIEDRFAQIGLPDGFIQKPFEIKKLKETLGRVLADTDDRAHGGGNH